MLRQTLKSCSHSKSDFFRCVLFELVISHIKKWFSNSFSFSSWYHPVTLPLCFLFHSYVHSDLPVFSVSHHFYNFNVQTFSHSINSIRLIYGLLYAVLQLWDFFSAFWSKHMCQDFVSLFSFSEFRTWSVDAAGWQSSKTLRK